MRKRRIAAWLMAPLLVLLVLMALLLSPMGSPLLGPLASLAVADLEIDEVAGSPLGDFWVRGLRWQNPQWQVSAGQIYLNLDLSCFTLSQVCIDTLMTNDVSVSQMGSPPPAEETPPSDEPLQLPLSVILNQATLTRTAIALPGQTIGLQQLRLGARLNDTLALNPVHASGLVINIDQAAVPETPAAPTSYALSYTAPELPDIRTPLPVTVEDFELTDITLNQSETKQTVESVDFASFEFIDTRMLLNRLHVKHPQGTLNGSLTTSLADRFPLSSQFTAQLILPDGATQRIDLETRGGLAELGLALSAEGAYAGQLQGSLNVLSDSLPVSLNLQWPAQPIPGMADGQLQAGQLNINGQMGDYQVTGDAGAQIPQLGQVPVTLDIVLQRSNIRVNKLDAGLLGGRVVNSGTLYLNEAISWEGTTRLKNLSSETVVPAGPTAINGELTSLLNYDSAGLHISVTDLSLNADQRGYALKANGSAVYSGPAELLVTSLQVTHGENEAQIAGQVLKNRFLKGSIEARLTQLETLYPGFSGAVTADLDIDGSWQDPGASGSIDFAEVRAPAALSPALAQQGALDGSIVLDGQLSDHQVAIDLSLADQFVELAIAGGWQDGRWKGQLSDTELGVFASRWVLQDSVTLAVRPTPFSTKIFPHCWASREDGTLCINDLLYKNDVARWDIQAEQLPAGLWASEVLGDLLPEAPPATLSLSATGKMPKGGTPQGQFALSMTPATWRLGQQQHIPIEVDAVQASGTLDVDTLEAQARLDSAQLGAIELAFTTQPFVASPPLEGKLTLEAIKVAPLKPISPAIRELSGALNGDIALSGALNQPLLNGTLQLKDGNLDIEDTPATISNWTQSITFDGQQAEFDGRFNLGPGAGSLTGSLNWQDPAQPLLQLALQGDQLEVQQRDITVRLSPDLTATVSPEAVKVNGQVKVPWARIKIEELPESAVAPSKDVHLRGEPPSEDPLSIVDADVEVIIDSDKNGEVKLEAFGLAANLAGQLQVKTQPALVGYGSLQIMDGRFQAYGQDLLIRTGEVQFNGPLDQPLLVVEAIRAPAKTDDGVIAGIRIDGSADNPNISVFTNPTMDQSNALSYLLTGSAPGRSEGNPNYAAMLLGMGLSNTNKIQGQLGEAFGIQDFSIGTTSGAGGNDPMLSVSGRINERLSVRYNFDVGLGSDDNTAETVRRRSAPPDLALRYRLLPRFYVEAVQTTIEEQTAFALDVYYQFFLGEEPDAAGPTEQQQPDSPD